MIKELLREGLEKYYITEVAKVLTERERNILNVLNGYYKLSGNITEDKRLINEYSGLLFEDDFDPFSHSSIAMDDAKPMDKPICVLSISPGNAKLEWPYLSLPAGYTCPMATICKNFAAKPGQKFSNGKSLKAGPEAEFMCYAARQQAQYSKTAGKNAFSNLKLLTEANSAGGIQGMANLIIESIEYHGFAGTDVFRIHEGGDFFSSDYMKAWIMVANHFSRTNFYTHTTSLNFWIANKGSIPRNMRLIASMDRNNEKMIMGNQLRYSRVVYSVEEAQQLKLKIDYDDSLACCTNENFALLIHGQQPAGSEASKAVSNIAKSGVKDKLKTLHTANKQQRDIMRKNVREALLKEEKKKDHKREYGCLMVYLDFETERWKELQGMIDKDDLYSEEGDSGYGLENEPHVTILYGLHGDIEDKDIEEDIDKITTPEVKVKNISKFDNDKFDVLKFDIDSKDLGELNKTFAEYPNTNKFPDYHPHMTIGYLKKGKADEYIKKLKDFTDIKITPSKIVYSKVDGSKKNYEL